MANKEFREIQVSSSLLVVIFLGVLALGVFIFLLGVSVGKNQARLSAPTQVVTQQIPEPVREVPVKPTAAETESGSASAPAGGLAPKTAAKDPGTKPPAAKTAAAAKKTQAVTGPRYYVQVAAFNERALAESLAEKYKAQGYEAVINPRQTSTKTWYRVRLGGYATRDQAAGLLDKLNAAAGKKTDFQIVYE